MPLTDHLLFIDTEASGLPEDWKKPYSEKDNWPFCVQIAWIIYSRDGQIVKQENSFIKENDFKISKPATKVHGITTSFLQVNGQRRTTVMQTLADDIMRYQPLIIGHFIEFDYNMLGVDFYRTGMENPIKKEMTFCTMRATKHMVRNPALTFLRLGELYQMLFHKELRDQHYALADAKATADCFFELVKLGKVNDEIIAFQQAEVHKRELKNEQPGCIIPVLFIIFLAILILISYE